jgi:hypothetical protein
MNIEAQNSFGRFRSRQYDLGLRGTVQVPAPEARNGGRGKLAVGVQLQIAPEYVAAFQKTRTGAPVRVELANQCGWKVGDHIPLMSGTAQLSGPTDWACMVWAYT